MKTAFALILIFGFFLTSCAHLHTAPNTTDSTSVNFKFDQDLTQFEYPFEVKHFETQAQGQSVKMAYMDVKPQKASGPVVVLLHGKNFSGFYFKPIMDDLLKKGHRVIVPDQIGFGKSSKPQDFQFSFHQLASLTQSLLQQLEVPKVILVGHSMGGMLATRFALLYPQSVTKLILINPIGLEDYKILTHYKTIDELYAMELASTEDKVRNYQKVFYYDGAWNENYEALLRPALGWLNGPDYPLIAKISAHTTEMLYTQPVVYEFAKLSAPTVLINGDRDKTAPGKPWALPGKAELMGQYPKLGQSVARSIPQGRLVELKGLGHVPFIEDYEAFAKVFFKEVSSGR